MSSIKKLRSKLTKPKMQVALSLALIAGGSLAPDLADSFCRYDGDDHSGDCEQIVSSGNMVCTLGAAYNDCN